MQRKKLAVFLGLFLCGHAFAPPPDGTFRIPGTLTFAPVLMTGLHPGVRQFYETQLAQALWMTQQLAPERRPNSPDGKQPFLWEGNRLAKVDFYIGAAFDPYIAAKGLPGNQVSGISLETDRARVYLKVYYLFDRIYFMPDQRPKKGAFLELVATNLYLVHGIIPFYLQRGPTAATNPITPLETWKTLIGANETMITGLRQLRESDMTAGLTPDDIARFDELIAEGDSALVQLRCREPN